MCTIVDDDRLLLWYQDAVFWGLYRGDDEQAREESSGQDERLNDDDLVPLCWDVYVARLSLALGARPSGVWDKLM